MVAGVGVTAIMKSGAGTFTVSAKVCVLADGAPGVVAEIETVTGPPSGVPNAAVTVRETVTGCDAIGLTELDGENRQFAPDGRPLAQFSVTNPSKLPAADTVNVIACDVSPWPTLNELGLGAVKLKSTTCKTTGASCEIACGSVPTACAEKV